MSIPLEKEVAEHLPWLFRECGFVVVEERYSPASFGNALVTLESERLNLRFVRDRLQVFIQIASKSEPKTWWDLHWVLEIIDGEKNDPGTELSSAADTLRQRFEAVVALFGSEYLRTKAELEHRAEQRRKRMLSPGTNG